MLPTTKAQATGLHATLDLIRDAVICADAHGNIIQMNHMAEVLTGWSERDTKGKPTTLAFKTIDEETGLDLEDPVTRILRGGSGAELSQHVLLVAKDGTQRPISISNSGARLLGDTNSVIGVALVFHDQAEERAARESASERTGAGEALERSERKYRLLFETAKDGILILDGDSGLITDVNPFLLELTGYARENVLGKHLWDLGFLKNIAATKDTLKTLQATQYVRYEDLPLESRDGDKVDVEFVSNVYHVEGRRIIQCNIRDITSRKHMEADRDRLIAAIEQAAEMIVVIDAFGTINYVNPAFEKVTGFGREEVIGSSARLLTSEAHDEVFFLSVWELVSSGQTWRGRMVSKKKDGSVYTEDVSLSPVRNAVGIVTGYVAVKHDVTRDLALEEQLRQAQKMEAVGRLAGGVAHDFNNVLSIILTYSDLAIQTLPRDHPLRADLEEIKKAGERAAGLTRQLLMFSRQEVIEPQAIDLSELIASSGKMLARLIGEDIELTVLPGPDLGLIWADLGQIEQVLMNLVINARDAMPKGGKLTIETLGVELTDESTRQHLGVRPGNYVKLAVTDTGVGMDVATQARMFEPFFTTKEKDKGTGLGLSTVFGITKQSNGHIWVDSAPGKGTTFALYFPIAQGVARSARGSGIELSSLGGAETILLVEDEEQIRMVLGRLLRQLGYHVLMAEDGADAIRTVELHPGKIDLLLTDVVMPGMSGADVAHRLLSTRPDLKVLCMSGYTEEAVLTHGIIDAGFAFIQKPIRPHELARKIRVVIGAGRDPAGVNPPKNGHQTMPNGPAFSSSVPHR